ncbi:hypothetical protein ACSS6W_002019 [Trichoderma asperelloides]
MFEFHMAWTALRLMGKEKKSVEWPWWFRNPPLSWLPYCRQYLDLKDENLESPDVEDLESRDAKILGNQVGKDELKKTKWTLAHCYFANMGGFMYIAGEKRVLATAQQLAEAEDLSYANPETTVEDIEDKSKQDWLAKLYAALQISQLILSIITRHIQSVQFSQLETVTLSFAICGVLIYWTYFHKPQNIERAIELKIDTPLSNDVSTNRAGDTQKAIDWISKAIKELEDAIATGASKKYSNIFGEMGPNTLIDLRDFLDLKDRFEDSDLKQFEPLDDKLFFQNFHRLVKSVRGKKTKKIEDAARVGVWPRQPLLPRGINQGVLYSTGFLYCASRLIILAISFSSLRKMPGSVYTATNWTEYMPTFGAMGG